MFNNFLLVRTGGTLVMTMTFEKMEEELTILGTRERHLGPQGYLLRY